MTTSIPKWSWGTWEIWDISPENIFERRSCQWCKNILQSNYPCYIVTSDISKYQQKINTLLKPALEKCPDEIQNIIFSFIHTDKKNHFYACDLYCKDCGITDFLDLKKFKEFRAFHEK